MGGVFNVVNLHLYHYAGNNPLKYVDPDGQDIKEWIESGINWFVGDSNYNGSGWGHGLRTEIRNGLGLTDQADGLIDTVIMSLLQGTAGNAHENNKTISDLKPPFKNLEDADTYADQLNNILGRVIALANPEATNNQLAKLALDEFYNSGLYTVSQNENGFFDVCRTTLSKENYNKANIVLEELHSYGLKRKIDK
ncbi:MAG: hypothetical protein P1P59_02390 [Treponemataceae bacterium]